MEEVVGKVVTDIAEDAAAEDCLCDVWVPVKEGVREAVEGGCEDQEEGWRHH